MDSVVFFIFETRDDRHKTPLSRPSCVGLEDKSSPSEEKEEKAYNHERGGGGEAVLRDALKLSSRRGAVTRTGKYDRKRTKR